MLTAIAIIMAIKKYLFLLLYHICCREGNKLRKLSNKYPITIITIIKLNSYKILGIFIILR